MKHLYILTLLSGLCLTNVFDAGAVRRYVKTGGKPAADAVSAQSWADACEDLQAVINASASGDEIWVAEGVYKPIYTADGYNASTGIYPNTSSPDKRDNAFVLKDGVKIYGGFPANANDADHTSLASRNWTANKTVLSGDFDGNDSGDAQSGFSNMGENAHHVVIGVGLSASAVLDGFTITGGNANGDDTYISCNGEYVYRICGGGMYNRNSSPTLTSVIIAGNTTNRSGGGMYNFLHSSPTLTNVTITGNTANGSGGGIHNTNDSSPTLTNVTITDNTATSNGGGMYNIYSSFPKLYNTILWGNTNTSGGASGVSNSDSSTPSYSYCLIQDRNETDNNCINASLVSAGDVFVDADAGNYNLKAGSPAINAGDNSRNSEPFDLAGRPRISGGTIDMGAYESTKYYYVKDGGAGSKSGDSWADASGDLQAMINAAASGDEIWVAEGIYTPTHTADGWTPSAPTVVNVDPNDRDNAFVLRDGVKIYGGFPASASDASHTSLADRDWTAYKTVLSGDLENNDVKDADGISTTINGNNACHTVIGVKLSASTLLDGLIITGGNAEIISTIYCNGQDVSQYNGGGMFNSASSPTLTGVAITGNRARYGGGMYNDNHSSPTLTHVAITGNRANYGGGMYNLYSSPTLAGVTIAGNTATDYASSAGGGMYNLYSSPTLAGVTITGNTANSGGGMYNSNSSPTLAGVTITGNRANNAGGGGMFNADYSSPTLTGVTITGNTATGSNAAGGGMYNADSSSPTLTNVTIAKNTANYGGGMYNLYSSSPTLTNVTIAKNTANDNYGGGIYNNYSSDPKLYNTILWGNMAAGSASGVKNNSSFPSYSYCLIQGETSTANSCIDALQVSDGDVFVDFAGDDYRLPTGCSPAVNAGSDAHYQEAVEEIALLIPGYDGLLDLDGNPRKNGPIDMGAYEYQGATVGLSLADNLSIILGESKAMTLTGTPDWTVEYEIDNVAQTPLTVTSSSYDFTPAAAGTYTFLSVTDNAAGCTRSLTGVSFTVMAPEPVPSITVIIVDEKLDGFDPGSIYYVISAADDTTTVTGAATHSIPDEWMTGETFSIVKKGDGTTTVNSPAQPLDILERPAAPALTVTHAASVGGNGSIDGTDNATMRYSADSTVWTACDAVSTELAPGTWYVHIKETGAAFRSKAVTLTILPTEAPPSIDIDFEYETLTGFDSGSVYYVITAAEDTTTVTGGTPLNIPDEWMTGETFSIVKKGNGTTTVNSPAQPLVIPVRPPAPSGLAVTHAVAVGGDGSITGTTAAMQHSTDSTLWTDCDAGSTELAPGTYYVHMMETGAAFRSKAVTLTILPTEAPPSIDIDFEYETLTGFDSGSVYYVITAAEDTTTVTGGTPLNIPDEWMTGETFSIVKKGDGTTTVNSPAQPLVIPVRPPAPSGLAVTNAVAVGGNGSITGTTTAMQHSTDSTLWTDCTAGSTDLPSGTYYVHIGEETNTAFRSLAVTLTILTVLPPEPQPSIDIDYTDEALTGFDPGSVYYVISAGLDTTTVSGVAALDIPDEWMGRTFNIVKKGDGTTSVNSPAQPLTLPTRPAAPSTPGTEEETAFGDDDGRITGLPAGTEYSADGGQTWHGVSGTQIAGLAPGQYLIRQKATPGSFPGQPATVTLRAMPRIDFSPVPYMYSGSSYTLPAVVTDPAGLTVHYSLRPEDAWMASVSGGVLHVLYPGVVELTACTEATATCQAACLTVRITASDPPVPAIMREVVLPQVAGVTTDPPAGTYHVESHHDFIFTLTLAVPSATAPAVRTIYIPDGSDSGSEVGVTPAAAPGSYTVRIRSVTRSPLQIVIELPADTDTDTGTAAPPSDAARVWTAAGHLHIVSPAAGEARVYSATGMLIKIIRYEAGETVRVPLPKGFHAVVLSGGKTVKIMNYEL